jgi:hypothetical protein
LILKLVILIFPYKVTPKTMNSESIIHKLAGGDILVWLDESGAICIKTKDKFNDPVELAEHEALALADLLMRLVKETRG